jgi:class 3 adenylate cyclase
VTVHAAITAGAVRVGSTRTTVAGESRWAFKAQGALVDQATDLARGIIEGGVVAAGDAAAAVGKRFSLEPIGGGAHRVLAPKARPPGERSIRTILVTDIVESTRTADQVGDRAWGELLAAHERSIREELVLFGGEEIDTTGDGFLASFDSAARAIQCALAVRDRVAELGLTIRTGLHTGEIERVGGRDRGIALHIASRIAARANAAEVLVSATTRELAAGAGLTFSDQGEHTLRGVSEPRRLYAVES